MTGPGSHCDLHKPTPALDAGVFSALFDAKQRPQHTARAKADEERKEAELEEYHYSLLSDHLGTEALRRKASKAAVRRLRRKSEVEKLLTFDKSWQPHHQFGVDQDAVPFVMKAGFGDLI